MTPSTRRELEGMTPEEFVEAALAVGQVQGCVKVAADVAGITPFHCLHWKCESDTKVRACPPERKLCDECCDKHACEGAL